MWAVPASSASAADLADMRATRRDPAFDRLDQKRPETGGLDYGQEEPPALAELHDVGRLEHTHPFVVRSATPPS